MRLRLMAHLWNESDWKIILRKHDVKHVKDKKTPLIYWGVVFLRVQWINISEMADDLFTLA